MNSNSIRLPIVLSFCMAIISPPASAQKTDRIMLLNGDWVTGEIKQLDAGMLTYKTDAAGTLSVKWEQVRHVISDKILVLRLSDGDSFSGALEPTENSFEVLVRGDVDTLVNMNYIVEITPYKNRFWNRLDGSFDFGFSYTKASEVKQTNIDFNVEHRGKKALNQLQTTLINTVQPGRATARKVDTSFRNRRYFSHNFAGENMLLTQRNTELDLKLRGSYGLGVSKNWIRSNTQRLYSGIGPLLNVESSFSEPGYSTSLDSFIYAEYRIYKYRDPEVYVTSTMAIYPSLSNFGRIRSDLQANMRFEIFNNFFLGFTFYLSSDNQPVSEEGSTNDWGFSNSIGYTF